MKKLKKLFKRVETLMAATAFAEGGEFETARQIMKEEGRPQERAMQKAKVEYTSRISLRSNK